MESFNIAFSVGNVGLTWNAIILAFGILVAVVVSGVIVKKRGAYKDLALDACIIGIPAGLIGGRLFSALSGKIAVSALFDLSQNGMNLPGALLFVGIGIAIYARVKKLSVSEVFDILAPGAFFGLAVGRWSDFFLCDGLGPVVGSEALKFFPLSTFTPQYFTDHNTVAYAVFFLDYIVCLALGIAALLLRNKPRGTASRSTIILYLFAEFILEWLRDGSTRQILFGQVRFNHLVLMAMLLFFVGLSLYRAKRDALAPQVEPPESEPETESDKREPEESFEPQEAQPCEPIEPQEAQPDESEKPQETAAESEPTEGNGEGETA